MCKMKWEVLTLLAFVLLFPALVFSGTIQLPKTGQRTSYASGDDGAIQAGVTWPSPRFADNGDETAKDNLTGLIWTKNANAPGPSACGPGTWKTWQVALDYVACLNTNQYLGFNDWRLPNINELESLVDFSQATAILRPAFTGIRLRLCRLGSLLVVVYLLW